MVRVFLLGAALCCGSCAPALLTLPSGAGTPAADGADALRDATRACLAVSAVTAEIGVRGSVDGRGLRARMLAGLAAPASARLEAVAPFGQPIFVFVARGNDATLLLPRDRRVLEHGRPGDVLDAVAGVPLDAADLRVALTGCAVAPRANEARQVGEAWRIVPDGAGHVYLHRTAPAAPWRMVAAVRQGAGDVSWRAEYRDFPNGPAADGLPRTVRLSSLDGKRFDLQLTLSQLEVNTPLGPEVFSVVIPPGTETITLDELKRSGPLANNRDGR